MTAGPDGDGGRSRARADAQHLMLRVQADLAGSTAAARELVARAEAKGWWDVAVLAEYVAVVAAATGGDATLVDPGVEAVGRLARRSGDPAALALALALRVSTARHAEREEPPEAVDADLARAAVLLESGEGGALERVAAHIECGLCYSQRHFWEMEAEQYEHALAVDPVAEEPLLAPLGPGIAGAEWAIRNNQAELECHWQCARYLVGDRAALAADTPRALATIDAAVASGVPPEWLPDLSALRVLVEALAGADVGVDAERVSDRLEPGTPFHGLATLAGALGLRHVDPPASSAATEIAIDELGRSDLSVEHDVALLLAVELEADRAGQPTAGLRLARHEHVRRDELRVAGMRSMQALVRAERFGVERASLERDARLDELTRLANRRGYQRYLERLERSPARHCALLLVDVDHFKDVNDRFGHDAGDRALRRVAGVIAAQARPDDIAARIGGDEFALLLDGADADVAARRAEQILTALGRAGRDATEVDAPEAIRVSIGIAHGPTDEHELLARRADTALYRAKAAGGGQAVMAG